jgi:hypothetical protein
LCRLGRGRLRRDGGDGRSNSCAPARSVLNVQWDAEGADRLDWLGMRPHPETGVDVSSGLPTTAPRLRCLCLGLGVLVLILAGVMFAVPALPTRPPTILYAGQGNFVGTRRAWGMWEGRIVFVDSWAQRWAMLPSGDQPAQARARSASLHLWRTTTDFEMRLRERMSLDAAGKSFWPVWHRQFVGGYNSDSLLIVAVPAWQAATVLALCGAAVLWKPVRAMWAAGPGECPRCRYSLAGLSSGAHCPECGPLPQPARPPARCLLHSACKTTPRPARTES